MLHITITRWMFSCLLLFTSAAYARTPLDFITAVDRERDHLRRQLKDPEEFIKPLSMDVSFYIAGQKKLNYERKLTPEERQAALKSILRTAIIHARFKEASFTEYFGEIKSGQRDLYYSHAAHVNVAYCAAQCLVEAQAPLDLEVLVKQVMNRTPTLDVLRRQPLLQKRFTEEYIAGFLGEPFIRWYGELNVGFPDISNQFVFDKRFAKIIKKVRNSDVTFILSHSGILKNVSDGDSFPCYVYSDYSTSCVPSEDKNIALCYELAEIMGLQGLVSPAYSFKEENKYHILTPFELSRHWIRTDATGREPENADLKSRLTNTLSLSKILTFWFVTQQTHLRITQWAYSSPDEVILVDVREGMGSASIESSQPPFPFGTRKLRNEDFCYYQRFEGISFAPPLRKRIQRLTIKDFVQVFNKYNVTRTESGEFLERLKVFQNAVEIFAKKPIHELFLHLWCQPIFKQRYQLIDSIEAKPEQSFEKMMQRAEQVWKQQKEEKKQRESGQLHPSKTGLGYVKYPPRLMSTSPKTASLIDGLEQARRRTVAYDAALKRKEEEKKQRESGQLQPSNSGPGYVKDPRPLPSESTKTVSLIDEADRAKSRTLAYEAALRRMKEAANSLGDS